MIGWLERLHDLFPGTKDIENESPETNLTVERRFFLSGPALLAASFMLLRARGVLASGATFDEITTQIAQLAIPMIAAGRPAAALSFTAPTRFREYFPATDMVPGNALLGGDSAQQL